jgi:hypothetical protein
MLIRLVRHHSGNDVYILTNDHRMAEPLHPSQWTGDGGLTPRTDWARRAQQGYLGFHPYHGEFDQGATEIALASLPAV